MNKHHSVCFSVSTIFCILLASGALFAHSGSGRFHTVEIKVTGSDIGIFIKMEGDRLLELIGRGNTSFGEVSGGKMDQITEEVQSFFDRNMTVRVNDLKVQPVFEHMYVSDRAIMVRSLAMVEQKLDLNQEPWKMSFTLDVFSGDKKKNSTGDTGINGVFLYNKGGGYTRSEFRLTPAARTYTWRAPGAAAHESISPVTTVRQPELINVPVASLVCLVVAPLFLLFFERRHPVRLSGAVCMILLALICLPLFTWSVAPPGVPPPERPSEQEARTIFKTLHKNIYRSFDYERRSDIYDTLRESCEKAYLEQVYLELLNGRNASGSKKTNTDVTKVQILDQQIDWNRKKPDQFRVTCRWKVFGTVTHWRHTHSRVNEYRAIFTVTSNGEAWKISGVDVLEHKRTT